MRHRTNTIRVAGSFFAVVCLVGTVLMPKEVTAKSGAKEPVRRLSHPAKTVTRPLKPNHQAFLQHDRQKPHHSSAHTLYGSPGSLRSTKFRSRSKHEGLPGPRPAFRAGSTPRAARRVVRNERAHGAKAHRKSIRRLSTGCPTGWTCSDIGSDSPAGSVPSYTGSGSSFSSLQMTGGGPGVNTTVSGHSTEGFYFVQKAESGDFSLSAQDSGQTTNGSSPYDSEGLALRAGTGTSKADYYVYVVGTNGSTLEGGIYVDYISANGGSPTNLAMVPVSGQASPGSSSDAATCDAGGSATCYLAIERRTAPDGSKTLEAYWSQDGANWQAIWGSTVNLQSTDALYSGGNVGMAATSDTSGSSATANFSSVNLTTSSLLDEFPAECPSTFQCAPVGGISKRSQWAIPGNSWSSSPWTISAGGSGLSNGGTTDQFQWIYQPMNSDGTVSTQVGPGYEFYAPTDNYGASQFGVMVRSSTVANAPYFAVFVTPCQGVVIAYRTTSGGTATVSPAPQTCSQSQGTNGLGTTSSEQVMVQRTGNSFQARYDSGSGWTSDGSPVTISAIPSQAPAGDFADSTISGWQSWADFSSTLVSSDVPTSSELLGQGRGGSVLSSGNWDGPGNEFTGNYTYSHADLSIPGRGLSLDFSRRYNSLTASQPSATLAPFGNLGPGWTDSSNMFITSDGSGDVTVQQEDGSAFTFGYETTCGSTYCAPNGEIATLQPNTGQTLAPNCPATALVMTRHDQSKYAFYQITSSPPTGQPSGGLCEALDINGYPTILTYNAANTHLTMIKACTTVSGTACGISRNYTLTYTDGSHPNSITAVTSNSNTGTGTLDATFTYNGSGQLATSADADGNTTYYGYNAEGLLNSIQTPNENADSVPGTLIWYDTSGRALYTQDAAAEAAGLNAITSYSYQCNYGGGTCSSDGTQTSTSVDANGNETQDVFVDGLMTSQTQGVGTAQEETSNYSVDQNTLGIHTKTEPANGSGASYLISYTNWYGTGTYLGDVKCSVQPGKQGPTINATAASWTSTNGGEATLTFASTTAPVVGGTMVVSGVSNNAYNGTFQVLASTTTSVTYLLPLGTSPGSGTGGSLWLARGNVTSYTYNSTYPNLVATTANPREQATSYSGACNSNTPTYETTNYYGSSNGSCPTAPEAWLLQCTVVDTDSTPSTLTTSYTYGNSNIGDVTQVTDPNGNTTTTGYIGHGYVASTTVTSSGDQCGSACGSSDQTTYTYYPDGQLETSVEPNGNAPGTANAALWTTTDTYDAAGNQVSETDPGTTLSVTNASWSSSTGRATFTFASTSTPPPANSYISVSGIAPSGYDGSFKVYSSTATTLQYTVANPGTFTTAGSVVQETVDTYDGDGNQTAETDPRGYTINDTYDYDDQQIAESKPNSTSPQSSQTYDAVGNQASSTDYGQTTNVISYSYDALNRQIAETVPGTGLNLTSAAWASTACGGSSGTETLHYSSTSSYPATGSYIVVAGVSPSSIDGVFLVSTSSSTSLTYCVASPPGGSGSGGTVSSATYTSYYPNGNQLTSVDPDGNVEYDTYYPSENQATVYSAYGTPDQTTETYGYDADGNTTSDKSGTNTTTNTYNDVNWNMTTYDQLSNTTTYAYDADGSVITETDPGSSMAVTGGSWTSNVATLTFATNQKPSVQGTIVVSGVTPSSYNGTFSVTASTSTSVSYSLPLGSNPGTTSGGQIQVPTVTHNTYDGANRLEASCVDGIPAGTLCSGSSVDQTSNTFDNDGNTLKVTDGDGNIWGQSNYVELGGQDLAATSTDPASHVTTSVYDANGNLQSTTNPDSVTTTNSYDGYNNLSGTSYSDGSAATVSYTYNPDGSVSQMTDGTGTTSYAYDGQGNLASETNGHGNELQYAWDPAGNMTSMTYPDGNTTTYTYNHQNEMSSLKDWLGHITSFTFDGDGNISTETLPNSTTTTNTYDSAERLDKVATTKSGVMQMTFDATGANGLGPDGNVQNLTTSQATGFGLTPGNGTGGSAGTDTYQYDPLSRMTADTQGGTGANGSNGTFSNSSEMASNTGAGPDNGTYNYASSNDRGQLNSITAGGSTTRSFTYNGDGDRTGCTVTSGTGSCSVLGSVSSSTYQYDAADRLMEEQDSGNTEKMYYDGSSDLSQETQTVQGSCPSSITATGLPKHRARAASSTNLGTGYTYYEYLTWSTASGGPTLAVTATTTDCSDFGHTDYIMGPGGEAVEQVEIDSTGTIQTPEYYYQDLAGNTRTLLDQSGNQVWAYNYPAWGVTASWTGVNGDGTPLQYSGSVSDSWNGLAYDHGRWYDPGTGQFVSQNPGVGETLQPYAYLGDNPAEDSNATQVSKRCSGWTTGEHLPCNRIWGGGRGIRCENGRTGKRECTGYMGTRGHIWYDGLVVHYYHPHRNHCFGDAYPEKSQWDSNVLGPVCGSRHSYSHWRLTTGTALSIWVCVDGGDADGTCLGADTFLFAYWSSVNANGQTMKPWGFYRRVTECYGACSPPDHMDCEEACNPWSEGALGGPADRVGSRKP